MTGRRATRSRTPRTTPPASLAGTLNQSEADESVHNTRASGRRDSNALRPELVTQSASSYGNPTNLAHNAGLSTADAQRGFGTSFNQRAALETLSERSSSPLAARAASAAAPKKQLSPRRPAQPRAGSVAAQSATGAVQVPAERIQVPAALAAAPTAELDDDGDFYEQTSVAINDAFHDETEARLAQGLSLNYNEILDRPSRRGSRGYFIAIFFLMISVLLYAARNTPPMTHALSYVKPILGDIPTSQDSTIVQIPPLTSALIPRPNEVAINFFSPGAGATVDPRLSTPSMYHFKDLGDRQNYPLLHDVTTIQQPNQALQPYHDIGDAWCTTTKHLILPEDGMDIQPVKAQLAVNLAHPVYPRFVMVNSPPSHVLLDPAARPGAMSLWIQVQDSDLRRRVRAAVMGVADGDVPEVRSERLTIGRAPPNKDGWLRFIKPSAPPTSDLALDETWVRVAGREHDDVVAADGQVFFTLDADMEALGVPVHRAVFRVESNLGQDYTCLYRVALNGKLVGA